MAINTLFSDVYFMEIAIQEAKIAAQNGEIPVGAVIVCNDILIAKTHNQTEKLNDVTAHAEVMAITAATQYLGSKYLKDCTLYVTLEPCVMCAGALFWSQIGRVVYGASDDKRGYSLLNQKILHPKTKLTKGILANEIQTLLQDFFRGLRT